MATRLPFLLFKAESPKGLRDLILAKDLKASVEAKNARECYRSVYRFGHTMKKHYEANERSVSEYTGLHSLDVFPIDIDSPDLEEARTQAKALVGFLTEYNDVPPHALRIYFSGNKGFHILIPAECFGITEPSETLHVEVKAMAENLLSNFKVDKTIYDLVRIFRINNTLNDKSGLYKISLTMEELMSEDVTMAQIKGWAKTPRDVVINNQPIEPVHELVESYQYAKHTLLKTDTPSGVKAPVTTNKFAKPCITALMLGVAEGQRNEACVRLADHWKKQGLTQTAVLGICMDWSKRCTPAIPDHDVKSRVNDAFTHTWDYGCNDSFLKGYCSGQCTFKPKAENTAKQNGDIYNAAESQQRYLEHVNNIQTTRLDMSKWLPSFGLVCRGFIPGHVVGFVAATGVGKTAIAQNFILGAGVPCLFFSMELPLEDCYERFLQIANGMTADDVEDAYLRGGSFDLEPLKNIYIVEKPSLTMESVMGYANIFKEKYGFPPRVIVIDFLGLMKSTGSSTTERIAQVATQLKELAKETKAVVVFLSQVSREKGGDGTTEIGPNSAKSSGEIDNACDYQFGAWRPALGQLDLNVLKARKGKKGTIHCNFDGAKMKITERITDVPF